MPFALFAALVIAEAASAPQPIPIKPEEWITSGDYPNPAIRAAKEGRVVFRLDVDATGAVTGCSVVTSSGSPVLDVHTCDLLRMRAHFQPAHDATHNAIPSEYSSTIQWTLPAGSPFEVPATESVERTTIDLLVGSDGRIRQCTVAELVPPSQDPKALSPCVDYPAGSRFTDPTTRNGQPVGGRVRITEVRTSIYDQP